jgi:hypothetical protein
MKKERFTLYIRSYAHHEDLPIRDWIWFSSSDKTIDMQFSLNTLLDMMEEYTQKHFGKSIFVSPVFRIGSPGVRFVDYLDELCL